MRQLGIEPPPNREEITIRSSWLNWFRRLRDQIPKTQTFSAAINPASVAANTTSEQTFTVSGLTTSDIVTVNKPTHTTGIGIVNARVSATNTLAITFCNPTGSPIDPPSETYTVKATRL